MAGPGPIQLRGLVLPSGRVKGVQGQGLSLAEVGAPAGGSGEGRHQEGDIRLGKDAGGNAVGEPEARILGALLFSLSRSKSQLSLNPRVLGPQPRAPSLECSAREWGCL